MMRGCSDKVNCTGLHGSGTQKRDLADEKRIHALLKKMALPLMSRDFEGQLFASVRALRWYLKKMTLV
ncbi:hypothetical protein [Bradyrhizobium sp. Ghvi]|uniref:hypothetical protein n=1 Tax=Bradyrhizobium sp. Ghvi TaxID=1855319 RepID=UPI001177D37D|nr:hypothetical protein [Bradyrhizobium sp. Ghvi]